MTANILGSILLLCMLALMAARTAPPMAVKLDGEQLLEVQLRPMFRLLNQRVNVMAILLVLILGSGFVGDRWISHGLFLFTIIAMAGLLLLPTRYRFTSVGVSPHRGAFRHWSEFKGWAASGNVLYLSGKGRFSSLKLYFTGPDRDEVLKVVNRFLPASETPSQPRQRRRSARAAR